MSEPAAISERERTVLGRIATVRGKPARFRDPAITMSHGAGGKATQTLIEGLFVPAFGGQALAELSDAGAVIADGVTLAFTTDSYVVRPLRFPGGSIGELAVNGTVNDLAVSGARPLALTVSLVLEEGLSADDLRAEVEAMARAAREAGVEIVAGDTKVVERGHADGMYVCTSGIGLRDPRATLSPAGLRPGDRILLSGRIGDHGTAIMLARGEFELDAEIESDTCSLWPAVDALLEAAGPGLRCLRDATRGGVASVLNELARASQVAMLVREAAVPVAPAGGGRGRDPGDRPDVRGQRGQAGGRRRAGGRARGPRGAAGGAGLRGRRRDRRGAHRAARDGAGGDELRRAAGHGPAGRRPAATDLLRRRERRWRARSTRPTARRRRSRLTSSG